MSNERADADAQDRAAAEIASRQRNRARILALAPDGTGAGSFVPHDVTEHVVTLLDAITNSLDWGSGFYNREDLVAWKALAELLAFDAEPISIADGQIQAFDAEEAEHRRSQSP